MNKRSLSLAYRPKHFIGCSRNRVLQLGRTPCLGFDCYTADCYWPVAPPRSLAPRTSPGLSDTIEGSFIRAVQTWDLNHDGKVTCEEWRTYAASLFKEADSDHDGKLTREEFAKLAKIDRLFEVANFDYYDVNKQGYVTQADFVDRPNPAFAALDHDKSCVINLYQLRAIEEASGERVP